MEAHRLLPHYGPLFKLWQDKKLALRVEPLIVSAETEFIDGNKLISRHLDAIFVSRSRLCKLGGAQFTLMVSQGYNSAQVVTAQTCSAV